MGLGYFRNKSPLVALLISGEKVMGAVINRWRFKSPLTMISLVIQDIHNKIISHYHI